MGDTATVRLLFFHFHRSKNTSADTCQTVTGMVYLTSAAAKDLSFIFFLHLTLTQYPELSTMMIFAGQQGETSVAALNTSLYITVMQLSFCDTLIMIPSICTIPLTKTH
jgi:hypothetical protein